MKAILIGIITAAVTLIGCADKKTSTEDTMNTNDENQTGATSEVRMETAASSDEVVTHYLHIKNALVKDNGKEAATAGEQLQESLLKLDNASFSADQKKVYDDVKESIKEHAQHISTNAGEIAHQREHFDMLSQDMYDFIKSVKPGQALYKDHCPMFNDKKGAFWLSEVKEIQNPYYGKKMLTCGEVQEEIK